MDPTSNDVRPQDTPPRAEADKLVMRSVVSYQHLLGMIEERNPILAHRQGARDRQRSR